MKSYLLVALTLATSLMLAACESMPEKMKDDGRASAERAKANAEKAYEDMKDDM